MTENLTELPWDEIAGWFPHGMIPWMKRNYPDRWDELLSIEKELNAASMALDEDRTANRLTQYRDFVLSMRGEFESRKKRRI